jgi:hypothetical protein
MTEHLQRRLALFDGVPVVNLYGILNSNVAVWVPLQAKFSPDPEDMGTVSLIFDIWRVEREEIQTHRIHMTTFVSRAEWKFLEGGPLRNKSVIHVRAKIAQNKNGFQEALFVEWIEKFTTDTEIQELYRQLTEPITLNLSPLAPLQLFPREGVWCGTIVLNSWDKFTLESEQNYRRRWDPGYDLTFDSRAPHDQRLSFLVGPPSPEQIAAYVYVMENEKAVQDAILQAILSNYPQWQRHYKGEPIFMPDVTKTVELQSLLLLWDISIRRDTKNHHAPIDFHFIRNWNIEHGLLLVRTHKNVVVQIEQVEQS